jgi:hypothetical protein
LPRLLLTIPLHCRVCCSPFLSIAASVAHHSSPLPCLLLATLSGMRAVWPGGPPEISRGLSEAQPPDMSFSVSRGLEGRWRRRPKTSGGLSGRCTRFLCDDPGARCAHPRLILRRPFGPHGCSASSGGGSIVYHMKRRWFQLHSRTWIAMILTAGGLIMANLRGEAVPGTTLYGWPDHFYSSYDTGGFVFILNRLLINVVFAASVLFNVAFISEYLIRSRIDLETHRRWFRIHLSTAIVAMLVASLFLWLNSSATTSEVSAGTRFYGWPLLFAWYPGVENAWVFVLERLVIDVAYALTVVLNSIVISESLIRRRSKP